MPIGLLDGAASDAHVVEAARPVGPLLPRRGIVLLAPTDHAQIHALGVSRVLEDQELAAVRDDDPSGMRHSHRRFTSLVARAVEPDQPARTVGSFGMRGSRARRYHFQGLHGHQHEQGRARRKPAPAASPVTLPAKR